MGVINITPDSFSDGGRFLASERALAEAQRQLSNGADVLDLGAQSTALELRRLALRRNCADCYLRSKQYGSTAQRP